MLATQRYVELRLWMLFLEFTVAFITKIIDRLNDSLILRGPNVLRFSWNKTKVNRENRDAGWWSCESTRNTPINTELECLTLSHVWVEFSPLLRRLSSGFPAFLPLQIKPTFLTSIYMWKLSLLFSESKPARWSRIKEIKIKQSGNLHSKGGVWHGQTRRKLTALKLKKVAI